MIICLLVLSILCIVFCIFMSRKLWGTDIDIVFVIVGIFGTFLAVAFMLSFVFVGNDVLKAQTYKQQQRMYESQNIKIESDVKLIVMNYMEYEQKTIKEITGEEAITYAKMYPQLNSSDLVAKEIQLHTDNINKINDLKAKYLEANVARWFLYFGWEE